MFILITKFSRDRKLGKGTDQKGIAKYKKPSGNVPGIKKCVPYLTPERIQHHNQTMLIN